MGLRFKPFAAAAGSLLAVLLFVPASAGAIGFSAAANYSLGASSGPTSVAVGDFDGNSIPDLAATSESGSTAAWAFGSDTTPGTFGGFQSGSTGADGSDPQQVIVDDFNNDGKPDMAAVNLTTQAPAFLSKLSIFLGTGSATPSAFPLGRSYNAGASATSLASGYFNNDTLKDIVVANPAADTVTVLINTGGGTFNTSVQYTAGNSANYVAVADFNGDSKADIAVSNGLDNNVSILKGNGNGTFGAATNFPVGSGPLALVAGDFNNDGKQDVVTANTGGDNVSLLTGNGDGTFAPAVNFAAGDGASALAAGDLDNNGVLDLAVANRNAGTVSVLLANGPGSFAAPADFAVGSTPDGVAIGDFRGVGIKDLAVANYTSGTISVLLQKSTVTFSTNASVGGVVGDSISDAAHVFGGDSPTGTVTFQAFTNSSCTGSPAFTDTKTVNGGAIYTSADYATTAPGNYYWLATYSGDSKNYSASHACGLSTETSIIGKRAAALSTQAANATYGGTVTDTATLSSAYNATGTITFNLYGAADTGCTGTPVFATSKTVSGAGDYTSAAFTPTGLGAYRWKSSYSGDANNFGASGVCNATGETSTVSQVTPGLSTQATSVAIGNPISDTATLTGGNAPTGTLSFTVWGPGVTDCNSSAIYFEQKTVSGNGPYTVTYNPAAGLGTYRWKVSYSGDADNAPVSGACNDPGENSEVSKATGTVTNVATATANVGDPLTDTATLAGAYNPTGTMNFVIYDDATCQNVIAVKSATVLGNGDYTSPAYTPDAAGTYRWIAIYSGDANNEQAQAFCNDPNSTSAVMRHTPAISTQATATTIVGGSITDTATLAGGQAPTGTITFKAYGPGDADCSRAVAFTQDKTVSDNGDYTTDPAFTPDQAGTYRWTASYSGDVKNDQISGACNDAGETSAVGQATPGLTAQATPNVALGAKISDTGGITGGNHPTGTLSFKAYGPNDSTCTGTAAFSGAATVDGDGEYTPDPAFTPTAPGTYRWIASYLGDPENAAVSGACNDPNQTSEVAAVNPPPPSAPSNAFTIGPLKKQALTVTVASAGGVQASANKLIKSSGATGGPGALKLTIRLTKKAKKKLKAKGKVTVNAQITYTPTGGAAAVQAATLRFKKRKK